MRVESRRRRAAVAVVALAALGLAGAGTLASYTDQDQITDNTFQSGYLDLVVGPTTTAITTEGMAPDDRVIEEITVANEGTVPLDYSISVEQADDSETLGEVLNVSMFGDIEDASEASADSRILHQEGFPSLETVALSEADRTLHPGETETLFVEVHMQRSAEIEYHQDSTTFEFTFDAVQSVSGDDGADITSHEAGDYLEEYDAYFAGIIDTTRGNIQDNDASQEGKRYALLVAPQELRPGTLPHFDDDGMPGDFTPDELRTRWDGLTATQALCDSPATFPAAESVCAIEATGEGASDWYMPAMDELALVYRSLGHTYVDANWWSEPRPFPGPHENGEDLSSSPPHPGWEVSPPEFPRPAEFAEGGAQELTGRFWTITESNPGYAWDQEIFREHGPSGSQSMSFMRATWDVLPVRHVEF